MADYIIINNTNSFVIKKGENSSPYSRNDLRVTFSADNDQILKIYDKSVNNYPLHEITLGVDTVDVGGVTVFADAQALFDEIEPIFFLTNSGGGVVTVPTSDITTINQGDWVVGGTSGFYFDITHTLSSKDLLHDVYDITGGSYDGIELNEYLPQTTSVYRVESTVNTIDVVVVLSTGGVANVINTLNTDDTIIADASPLAVGGKLIKVLGVADIDITIDTGFLLAGQTVVFANKTGFAMNFIIGTQDVKASGSNSFVGFGQYSLVTFVHDGTDIILSGDTA